MAKAIPVYFERGAKRTFACAIEWPGWCRSGRDDTSTLQALLDSGPRYARIVRTTRLGFRAPASLSSFRVVRTLRGNATTDFGAPGIPPREDDAPLDDAELKRLGALLAAVWRAFDAAVRDARGKRLAKGPRGGGRDLEAIMRHVSEAEAGYLAGLGWKFKWDERADRRAEVERTRSAVLDGLAASAHGEIAAKGPRGGRRWRPRYFVRRLAWHAIDHTWEIEDRVVG